MNMTMDVGLMMHTMLKLIEAGVLPKDVDMSQQENVETVMKVVALHAKNNGKEVTIDGVTYNKKEPTA